MNLPRNAAVTPLLPQSPNPLVVQLQAWRTAIAERQPAIDVVSFVLQHGQEFKYQVRPDEFLEGPPKRCWHNSWELAKAQDLIYVEGYAAVASLPVPIHHGWCVRPGTLEVIDVTSPLTTYYFGIAFRPEYITRLSQKQIPLLDDWRNEWPLLRLPPEQLQQAIFKIEERNHGCENAAQTQAPSQDAPVRGRHLVGQRTRPSHRKDR